MCVRVFDSLPPQDKVRDHINPHNERLQTNRERERERFHLPVIQKIARLTILTVRKARATMMAARLTAFVGVERVRAASVVQA